MGRADVYLQPDAPDPVLDPATVLDLARRHVARARSVTAVDESGGEARAYMIDGDVVVKTQRPHRVRPRTSLAKEAFLLDRLAAFGLGHRVPRVFGYGSADTTHGQVEYLCLSRMPGRAVIDFQRLTGPARARLFTDLAALLRAIHGLDIDPPVARRRLPVDADGAALRTRLAFGFADLTDSLGARPYLWRLPVPLEEVAARALAALPDALAPPVALHSNPGRTHVFVDPESGTMTGLIDFGDAYLSHPAMDLRSWPDPADRRLLFEAYHDGREPGDDFCRVWTVIMIHADAGAIVGESPYAEAAATHLLARLARL